MMLAGLGGCAGLGQNDAERTGEVADVRAKLGLGRCDADLARQTLALKQPELEQEAAFVCLQQAEFGLVDRLLADYEERYASPPNPDYSAYLLALTEFLRFEAALGDAQQRLLTGRIAHAALVGFVRGLSDLGVPRRSGAEAATDTGRHGHGRVRSRQACRRNGRSCRGRSADALCHSAICADCGSQGSAGVVGAYSGLICAYEEPVLQVKQHFFKLQLDIVHSELLGSLPLGDLPQAAGHFPAEAITC